MCCIAGRLILIGTCLMLLGYGLQLLPLLAAVLAIVYVAGVIKVYRRNNRAQAEALQAARDRDQQWRA
jgi:uncharacterized membrane protein